MFTIRRIMLGLMCGVLALGILFSVVVTYYETDPNTVVVRRSELNETVDELITGFDAAAKLPDGVSAGDDLTPGIFHEITPGFGVAVNPLNGGAAFTKVANLPLIDRYVIYAADVQTDGSFLLHGKIGLYRTAKWIIVDESYATGEVGWNYGAVLFVTAVFAAGFCLPNIAVIRECIAIRREENVCL